MATANQTHIERGLKRAFPFGVATIVAQFVVGVVLGIVVVLTGSLEGFAQVYADYQLGIVLPAVLLVFFSRNFAKTNVGKLTGDDPVDGAKAGALIVGGYAPAFLVLQYLSSILLNAPLSVETLVLRGVAFPLVFGAAGGALSRVVDD